MSDIVFVFVFFFLFTANPEVDQKIYKAYFDIKAVKGAGTTVGLDVTE